MNTYNLVFNKTATNNIKNTIDYWLNTFKPQYMLTIQFPMYQRTSDMTKSNKKLVKIMLMFERILLGRHWNRKHIPFISIAENGKSDNWHYHILIYDCPFNFLSVQRVIDDISIKLNLPHEVLFIEPVNDNGAANYVSKEFISDINNYFDSDRITTSEILFNLSLESTKRVRESQKQSQNHEKRYLNN